MIDRGQAIRLTVALAATIVVFSAVGLVLVDLLAPNTVTRLDDAIADRFAGSRTPLLDDAAHWGSMLAATQVKIGLTALSAVIAWVAWRRWHEPVFLVVTLLFEASVFIVVTLLVARPRPDVAPLEGSPVDSSFPSGHVAAAVVYGAVVVVLAWHTRSRWVPVVGVAIVAVVVLAVSWSRMYQGMHHLSDVVAGVVLGLWSLAVCHRVLGSPPADSPPTSPIPPDVDEPATHGEVVGARTRP